MSTHISAAKAAAREQGRRSNGEFGETVRDEATSFTVPGMEASPIERGYFTPKELAAEHMSKADWTAPEAMIVSAGAVEEPCEGQFRRVKMRLGGEPYVKHTTRMAAETYDPIREVRHGWVPRDGKKVTILARTGVGDVGIRQGTLKVVNGRPALIAKGSRSGKGVWLDDERLHVLAVADGYNQGHDLAQTFTERMEIMPETRPFTLDGIPDEGTGQRTPAATFLVNHPGFDNDGGGVEGCVFVATDITADGRDPIVNGYFWAPDSGMSLTSEFSSMRRSDLEKWGACRLEGRPGFDLSDPLLHEPCSKDDMYSWLANTTNYDT